jgi:hypothetical protein
MTGGMLLSERRHVCPVPLLGPSPFGRAHGLSSSFYTKKIREMSRRDKRSQTTSTLSAPSKGEVCEPRDTFPLTSRRRSRGPVPIRRESFEASVAAVLDPANVGNLPMAGRWKMRTRRCTGSKIDRTPNGWRDRRTSRSEVSKLILSCYLEPLYTFLNETSLFNHFFIFALLNLSYMIIYFLHSLHPDDLKRF